MIETWGYKKYFWLMIGVLALFIALYHFDTAPGFWFDEGIASQVAKNIAFNGIYGTQIAPNIFYENNFWVTINYPVVVPTALFLKLFGVSVWAARLTSLFYLVGLTLVSYFFIKKLYGFKSAVLSSILLVTFLPFYGNGKAVLGEVPGLFWLISGSLLFLYFYDRGQSVFLFGAAVSWGLSMATKPYYLLFGLSAVFIILFLWLKERSVNFSIVVLSGVFLSLPVLVWCFFAFDFSSLESWRATLSYFLNSYGVSSFEPMKNLFKFVSESTPVHFALLGGVVFVSWFARWRELLKSAPLVVGLAIFIALSFLWYLKTPGWYRYFFPIHILVILFFAPALDIVTKQLVPFFAKEKYARLLSISSVMVLIVFQAGFLVLHYNDFYSDRVLELQEYATDNIPKEASIFVASKPEAAFILDMPNLYQYIFINKNLIIGENILSQTQVDYLITGRAGDQFVLDNEELINRDYILAREMGYYRIYKLKI